MSVRAISTARETFELIYFDVSRLRSATFVSTRTLLFYSAEKYFQSVQALLFLFRRIAILSLPKEKASWQLKALFGFCWITIHPLLPRPSGRPTGLTVVLNIIAIGGLSISFIPVATIWEPLLFYRVWKSLSWNYIKKSPSSNNNFVTVIYFGNWACRGFLFHIANCCSAVYSVCISKTKCWEMVCFIFIFGGYDNCISWFSCFNVDKRYLTIL